MRKYIIRAGPGATNGDPRELDIHIFHDADRLTNHYIGRCYKMVGEETGDLSEIECNIRYGQIIYYFLFSQPKQNITASRRDRNTANSGRPSDTKRTVN